MADRYRPDDSYEREFEQEPRRGEQRGRAGSNGGERYAGGYEGAQPGRFDDQRFRSERESAPSGRYGQGQSSSRYGQQGWEREQQPDRYTRPNDWSQRLQEGEWQRQQQWELEGGASAGWMPEQSRRQQQYSDERRQGNRGGAYGMEYPESGYRSPGGYGEMYRGQMGQSSGQNRDDYYGRPSQSYGPESQYGQYSGRGPRGYKRSDDRIREDVCERLTRSWDVDAEDIEVRVKDGEVTLLGSVMDRHQKRMAEDAVEGVSGVRDVNNQLRAGTGAERQGQLASPSGQYRAQSTTSKAAGSTRSSTTKSTSSTRPSTASRSTSSTARPASATRSRPTGSTASRSTTSTPQSSRPATSQSSRTGTSNQSQSPATPSRDPFQSEQSEQERRTTF